MKPSFELYIYCLGEIGEKIYFISHGFLRMDDDYLENILD